MKITIRNLGVIKKAEIDLKPLTILVGPNNSGKTWLAYTLASIFGPYALSKYLKTFEEREIPSFYRSIDRVVEQITNKGSAVLRVLSYLFFPTGQAALKVQGRHFLTT
jgi:predicted ATPase